MELERRSIERTDFSAVRRGYDPDEVDRHLREIAEAVEELKRSHERAESTPASMAAGAAERVKTIVSAAETSAEDIESQARGVAEQLTSEARAGAQKVRDDAEKAAEKTRQQAESEAASHVQTVKDATGGIRERADRIESDLNALVAELRGAIESLARDVRDRAGSVSAELEALRSSVGTIGAKPGAAAATAPDPEEAEATTAVADYEAPPEEALAEETAVEAPAGEVEQALAEDSDAAAETKTAETPAEETVVAAVDEPDEKPAGAEAEEGSEGARLIALNMALNGTPREDTARYLDENFQLRNAEAILDEVYARVGR